MKKQFTKILAGRRIPAAFCAAALLSGLMSGQQTPNPDTQKSGTSAKMKSVPGKAVTRGTETPESTLSSPRSGVIRNALVQQDENGKVRRLEGNVKVDGSTSARAAADKFLEENAAKLGISEIVGTTRGGARLEYVGETKSLTGSHLTYQQTFNGLPVFDEDLKVTVSKDFAVKRVNNGIAELANRRGIDAEFESDEAAKNAAVAAVGGVVSPTGKPAVTKGIVQRRGGEPKGVYRVTFTTDKPAASWVVMVDGNTDEVISKTNDARYQKAQIFKPDPVKSSGVPTLRDSNNQDQPVLTQQMKSVTLTDLDGSGNLSGRYASTELTNKFDRARVGSDGFVYSRSDQRFEEVMTYHWVTEATKYVHSLGFTNVMTAPLKIDVNGTDEDNSSYSPSSVRLQFGTGGVDDAEDASIILHEFGHALLDGQNKGFGRSDESNAMHEAFGDYFAASFFAAEQGLKKEWEIYVGTWDATEYMEAADGKPAFLRHVGGNKKYPRDLSRDGSPHADGEIWSAALWEIRSKLGRKSADTLILESNFRFAKDTGFRQAAAMIIETDQDLNAGKNKEALEKIFDGRGLLASDETGTGTGTTTETGSAVSMSNQAWTGDESSGAKYEYLFTDGKTAKVKVSFPNGKVYEDNNASYFLEDGLISISLFSGVVTQFGVRSGSVIKGKTIFSACTDSQKANQFKNELIKYSKDKLDTKMFVWTARKASASGPMSDTIAASKKWTGADETWEFDYEFLAEGRVKVVVTMPDGTWSEDVDGTYEADGDEISLVLFGGILKQNGTFDGKKISGVSILEEDEAKMRGLDESVRKMFGTRTIRGKDNDDPIIEEWTAVPAK